MAEKQREGDRTFMQPSEPELEDFVSEDPKDLPTFDPTIRLENICIIWQLV